MAFETIRFRPDTATAAEWSGYHAHRRARLTRLRPWEEAPSDPVVQQQLSRTDPDRITERYLVRSGAEAVAAFTLQVPHPASNEFATGGHIAQVSGDVLAPWRRMGIGRAFLNTALEFMTGHGATVLEANTKEADGSAFLAGIGAARRSAQIQSRLRFENVDWDLVRSWRLDAEFPGAEVQVFSRRIPAEHLDEVGTAYNDLINDVPFDELEHGALDMGPQRLRTWYAELDATAGAHDLCLIREPDGTIAALTDIGYTGDSPAFVGQRFTGVRRDRRGRGYAKWVKAAMLEHVRHAIPSAGWMATENAESNTAMLTVNRQLGYVADLTKAIYQISRADLAAFCGQ